MRKGGQAYLGRGIGLPRQGDANVYKGVRRSQETWEGAQTLHSEGYGKSRENFKQKIIMRK